MSVSTLILIAFLINILMLVVLAWLNYMNAKHISQIAKHVVELAKALDRELRRDD